MDEIRPRDAFRALAAPHRRRLLMALRDPEPQDCIAVPDDVALDGEKRTELRIAFEHNHLPMLEERGFIEWDRDGQTVSTGPNFERIRPILAVLCEHEGELPAGPP